MPSSLCVLLVDDNPIDLELARTAFEELGVQSPVLTRTGGQAAIAYLRTPHASLPDVVVLDVNMPIVSGFDVLRAIKDDPTLCHIPVVMLSTSGSPMDVAQAYTLHASSYLVKEPTFTGFLEQIEIFLDYWRRCRLAHRPPG